jgi:hypothetical protein
MSHIKQTKKLLNFAPAPQRSPEQTKPKRYTQPGTKTAANQRLSEPAGGAWDGGYVWDGTYVCHTRMTDPYPAESDQ